MTRLHQQSKIREIRVSLSEFVLSVRNGKICPQVPIEHEQETKDLDVAFSEPERKTESSVVCSCVSARERERKKAESEHAAGRNK